MNFRLIAYWFVCTAVAVVATGYLIGHAHAAETVQTNLEAVAPAALITFQGAGVSEVGRAVLLFAGIFAVAYTYQKAWANFRAATALQKR